MEEKMLDAERYKRQIMLPEIGVEGQRKLHESKVLVIGAGGLGSPIILYLAAAGVGTIGVVDGDVVDVSNLQRQVLHSTPEIGRDKVLSAKESAEKINPDVTVIPYKIWLDKDNAEVLVSQYDIVVDATDRMSAKLLINDVCVGLNKPLVFGAIRGYYGNVLTIMPGCANYRDIFNSLQQDAPSSTEFGVLGVVPGLIGCVQATEVLKIILGIGDLLTNCVLTYDALSMEFYKFNVG